MNTKKIKLAVIGAGGYWGNIVTRVAIGVLEAPNVIGVDVRKDSLKNLIQSLKSKDLLSDQSSLKVFTDFSLVLKDEKISHVAICVPPDLHFKIAKKFLQAKKHILLTKPMALKLNEAKKLLKIAKSNNCRLDVDHTFLFHPAVEKLIETVKNGSIGVPQTYYASWLSRGKIQKTDVLWDLLPHPFSILLEFLNFPLEVSCFITDFVGKTPAEAFVAVKEITTNAFVFINVSWLDGDKTRLFKVRGSHNTIIFDDTKEIKERLVIKGGRLVGDKKLGKGYNKKIHSVNYPETQRVAFKWTEPLKKELKHFLKIDRNQKDCHNGAEKSIKVVKLIEVAHRSFRLKQTIVID